MPSAFDDVLNRAMHLSAGQRLTLAELLLASVDIDDDDVSPAWQAEIERRIVSLKSGAVRTIPAAQVIAQLRQIAPDR